jgi:hypothetical protein
MTCDEIKNSLIETLKYIRDRNKDVTTTDFYERERIEYNYYKSECSVFFVIINEEFFKINFLTTVSDARRLLNYIKNKYEIKYMCDRNRSFDTLVGNVETFIAALGIDNLIDYSYFKIIENSWNNIELTRVTLANMLLEESKRRNEEKTNKN